MAGESDAAMMTGQSIIVKSTVAMRLSYAELRRGSHFCQRYAFLPENNEHLMTSYPGVVYRWLEERCAGFLGIEINPQKFLVIIIIHAVWSTFTRHGTMLSTIPIASAGSR